jgi:hypothetical protein
MIISLFPMRRDDTLRVFRLGDVLTINGKVFDFTPLPDGAIIQEGVIPCEWIVGPVQRVEGELRITLILPVGQNPPHAVAFPQPIGNPPNGPISLPGQEA